MGFLDDLKAKKKSPGKAAPTPTPPLPPPPADIETAFAKRNPVLERYVPDALENALDAVLPDALERRLDAGAERVEQKIAQFKTDFNEGFMEVAGVLFTVANYAASKFKIQDLVFGVYHLADHHKETDASDRVRGLPVTSPATLSALLRAAEAATWAYCPTKESLERDAGIPREDILMFDPTTATRRPAHVLMRMGGGTKEGHDQEDHEEERLVWAFRGTTNLDDILTDICATTVPYGGGHAHWGMLESAQYFAREALPQVRAILDARSCRRLQLVGHSLGAGTAALLAHVIHNDPVARRLMAGIEVKAVGVATPAVLSADLAEACSPYVTSIVLLHDVVPRFSIFNVFAMKEEMDATRWGDRLAAVAADWAVPDVIERSATFQRMRVGAGRRAGRARTGLAGALAALVAWVVALLQRLGLLKGGGGGASAAASVASAAAQAQAAAAQAGGDGEVVAVFAPGKLYFVDRRDPPAEEAERLRQEQQAAREAAKKALEERRKEGPSSSSSGPAPADAAAGGDDDVSRAVELARHADHGQEGDLPDVDFYPGSTFSMIEAAPGERFRRIVLRESCLSDHLTGGVLQGCRQLLEAARREQGGSGAGGGAAAGGRTTPVERLKTLFKRGSSGGGSSRDRA